MRNFSYLIKLILLCWLIFNSSNILAHDDKDDKTVIVTVKGIKGEALKNVNNRLKEVMQPISKTTDANKVRFFYSQAKTYIQSSIEPFGFFKARVRSGIQHIPPHWYIYFNITPGPAIKITRVKLQLTGPGAKTKPFIRYKKKLNIEVGQPLNVNKFNKAKTHFLDIANKLGYFQAKTKPSHIKINLQNYSAQIILKLKTGKRYKFGKTTFNQSPYANSFLRRYMTYNVGEFYNRKKITNFQKGLGSSPYFSEVKIDPQPSPFVVPVKVTTTATKSQHYSIGGGWGSDTGPRVTGTTEWLRVNRYGHRFNLSSSLSQNENYIVGNYIIPGHNPTTSYYTLSSGIGKLDIPQIGHAKSAKVGASYNNKFFGWDQRISLEYLVEKYNLKLEDDRRFPSTDTYLLIPSISWTRRHVHKGKIPRAGYNINLSLSGARKGILTKSSFFQEVLSLKHLLTLPTGTRLIAGAQIGHTAIKQLNNLPLSLQFFAGGGSSLRGYDYQSIGPGRNMLIANVELQQKLFGNLYLVGFYDMGNVSDAPFDREYFKSMHQSAGPGIAYLTPVGNFELTVANRLIKHDHNWRVQFSIAPAI